MPDPLLTHLSETVRSVDEQDLQTVTTEFGAAFGGAGQDLQTIIDSGGSFLDAADANFEITTKLIRDGNVVADNLDLASLKREKDDAAEVREGFECGLVLRGFNDIKEGDIVEAFEMKEIPRA